MPKIRPARLTPPGPAPEQLQIPPGSADARHPLIRHRPVPSSAPVGGTARLSWADEEDVAAAEGTPGANDEDGDGEVVEPDSETDSEPDAEHAHPVTTGGQDEDWGGDQVTTGRGGGDRWNRRSRSQERVGRSRRTPIEMPDKPPAGSFAVHSQVLAEGQNSLDMVAIQAQFAAEMVTNHAAQVITPAPLIIGYGGLPPLKLRVEFLLFSVGCS